jgi:hypothetical protein
MSEQVHGSDGPAEMSDPSGRLERSADEFIEIFDVLLTGLDLKFSPKIPMCRGGEGSCRAAGKRAPRVHRFRQEQSRAVG